MRTLTWHHPLGDLFHPLLPSLPLSLSVSTTLAPLCRLQTSENQCSKCKPDRWPSSLTWARLWLQYMSLLLKPYSWLFTPAPPEVMQIIQLLCQKKRGGGGYRFNEPDEQQERWKRKSLNISETVKRNSFLSALSLRLFILDMTPVFFKRCSL